MKWQQAVVRVWDGLPSKNGKFAGTAFFIDPRTLLTAKHVVKNCSKGVYLEGAPGGGKEKIESEHISYSSDRDIAILKTSRPFSNLQFFNLSSDELKLNDPVTLAGFFDENQSLHIVTSEISGYVSAMHTLRTQGSTSRGMSGGPAVFRDSNKLAGIIHARDFDKNLAYLIPTDVILACLKKLDTSFTLTKAPLYNVPPLPAHYLERNEHLNRIKELLLNASARNVGITGISRSVGLQGMGGIGKSILATALANDDDIRINFPDGIIWISLGQTPDIVSAQNRILENLGTEQIIAENPEQGKSFLNKRLVDKKLLLILDDVWKIKDAKYFDVSTASKLLITTRHAQVLTGLSAEECKIPLLSTQQALNLLRIQSKWVEESLPHEAQQIVKECGALPLAISMVGAMLRGRPRDRWQRVLQHLQNAELQKIRQEFADYPYPDLFKAFHVSVAAQPATIQQRYLELAIFPVDSPIPESVLEVYWNQDDLQGYDSWKIIDELVDASLIFRHNENNLMLHDLQWNYLRSQCVHLKQCHEKLIDAYAMTYPLGWNTIPIKTHNYFYGHFPFHLQQAGNERRAKEIATNLLDKQSLLDWFYVLTYVKLTNQTTKEIAYKLIKTNNSTSTLATCLRLLGDEAKEDARRLLKVHQSEHVITTCLHLLGNEAKGEARRLVREHQATMVITACLRLLGNEAKEEARRLLREHEAAMIITTCLNLLGKEAKEDARHLLKVHQSEHVITACLRLLGNEAKEDARRLLKVHQSEHVITACLRLLGNEAKEDARRLLKVHQKKEVIIACLRLLGNEAKEDARHLLKVHQEKQVIAVSLHLLGNDKDAIDFTLEKLKDKNWTQLEASLKSAILRVPVNAHIRQKRAIEVLSNWRSFYRPLVTSALMVFDDEPSKVTEYCEEILQNWEHDINYYIRKKIPKYSTHITKSLRHPNLQNLARLIAHKIIMKENKQPGFLDEELYKQAQNIYAGNIQAWDSYLDKEAEDIVKVYDLQKL